MTTNRSKRKFSWWPGDVEWLSQKVDKWLVSGNGYSKLRASISTRSCDSVPEHEETAKSQKAKQHFSEPVQPSQPPATTSKLKVCLKYGEEVYKNYSEKLQGSTRRLVPVSRSFSAKEGKRPIQRQDWARSSYSLKRRTDDRLPKREGSFKSKTMQRFTSNFVPADVIFEKCKPRERRAVPQPCETESCWDEMVPCCVESCDVIYYPFREEDCVVCKYMLKSANRFRMNVEPLEHMACTSDGCHFLYGSKSFPCDTGQLHSGCKLTPMTSLVNTMSRCSLRETRIANDEPADAFYENNFQTQPTININQNYIEVRYDDNVDDVNGNIPVEDSSSDSEPEAHRLEPEVYKSKPERPPPTYMSVMRQDSSRVRPRKCTYQRQDGEDKFYVHDSPFSSNPRHPPSYESCADDNRCNVNRSTNLVPRRTNTMPRQNMREGPKYRSRGRFSHSFYETERAVRDVFEVNGNPGNSTLRRGNSFSYYRPASTVVVDNRSVDQSPRYQLREVDLRSSNPLRNVMTFRSRNGKSSSRRKKSVVVGEDGLHGPMWPRVLLTFDRGVTPNAPPFSSCQFVPSMTETDI